MRNVWVLAWISALSLLSSHSFAASGSISASPQTCIIPSGSSHCSSTISWSTSGATNPCIFLNTGQLFTCGASGSAGASWISESGFTFLLKNGNTYGSPTLQSVFVKGARQPTVNVSFSPNPASTGGRSTLSWSSSNATSCSGVPVFGTTTTSGSHSYPINRTTDWHVAITCTGPGGSTRKTAVLNVVPPPPPTVQVSFSPNPAATGAQSTLSWSSSNATSCSGVPVFGTTTTSGSHSYPINRTTDWHVAITCTGPGGSTRKTAVLNVIPPPPPTVQASFSPNPARTGESSTLIWSSTNADSCSGMPGVTNPGPTGEREYPITTTSDWSVTVTCTGPGGQGSATAYLDVIPPPAPTVTASFSPNPVKLGEQSTLTWESTNTTSCSGVPPDGADATADSRTFSLNQSADWSVTITCEGAGGTATTVATLRFHDPGLPDGAYVGDINSDGLYDFYVRQMISPLADTGSFLLQQNPDNSFSIVAPLNSGQQTAVDQWESVAVELVPGDFNIDGRLDLEVVGIEGLVVNGTVLNGLDQIAFAPPSAGGVLTATAVTGVFKQFFSDVYNWMQDPNYFEDNAPETGAQVWKTTFLTYQPAWCDYPPFSANPEADFPAEDRTYDITLQGALAFISAYGSNCVATGGRVIYRSFNVEHRTTKDYSVFSQNAVDFSQALTKSTSEDGLFATTSEAIVISEILSETLGVEVMNGVLVNGGLISGIEIGQSPDEMARDRQAAIEWMVAAARPRQRARPGCDDPKHFERIWGPAPISLTAHFARNDNQSDTLYPLESDLPLKGLFNGPIGFKLEGQTGTHNIGVTGNKDYRGYWDDRNPLKGWQLIYDSSGQLVTAVTDPANMGSYDFMKAGSPNHLQRDVTPWLEWGNIPADNTTTQQRVEALYSGWTGIKGLVATSYMRHFYRCSAYQE